LSQKPYYVLSIPFFKDKTNNKTYSVLTQLLNVGHCLAPLWAIVWYVSVCLGGGDSDHHSGPFRRADEEVPQAEGDPRAARVCRLLPVWAA